MANKSAGFITGANAKVKIGGKTVAYAADVSYNITVQTIPIETLGKYEVHSNEPVGYTVAGTFSVVRYTSRANTSGIANTGTSGNAPSKIAGGSSQTLADHIDPSKLLASKTWDLEVHEKGAAGVFAIEDCRLTSRGMTLNKRGVMVDQYAFVGILGEDRDETEGAVGPSGDADQS